MDISELERLAELVQSANVGELTLRHGGEHITIRKATLGHSRNTSLVPVGDPGMYTTEYTEIVTDEDESGQEGFQNVMVSAPLVGIFGHVKPLVGLHSRVTEGQVIGVIEAMKIMTEIAAPASGVVVDIFIEDGHPVEYGQALFEILPA